MGQQLSVASGERQLIVEIVLDVVRLDQRIFEPSIGRLPKQRLDERALPDCHLHQGGVGVDDAPVLAAQAPRTMPPALRGDLRADAGQARPLGRIHYIVRTQLEQFRAREAQQVLGRGIDGHVRGLALLDQQERVGGMLQERLVRPACDRPDHGCSVWFPARGFVMTSRHASTLLRSVVGRKIVVKGASGAGKSTLAAELARRLGVPYVELDALHHGPNWSEPTAEEFRARVRAAMDAAPGDGWVIDGNYERKLGGLVADAADSLVWLDLPLRTLLWRLWTRTSHRIRDNVELWNGNRESWRTALWGTESLFVWTIRSFVRHRREWPQRYATHPGYVRLRSPEAARAWLEQQPPAEMLR